MNSTSDMPLGAVGTTLPIAGMYFNNRLPPTDPFAAFMTVLGNAQGSVPAERRPI